MIKVLFVCLGNICRSPAAHAVMEKMVENQGLADQVHVDSAGTMGYHTGMRCDCRMDETLRRRGYKSTHAARKVREADFREFDYIYAMDNSNLSDLKLVTPSNGKARVDLFLNACESAPCTEVPDPYYGGQEGFDHVVDLAERACAGILNQIIREHALK